MSLRDPIRVQRTEIDAVFKSWADKPTGESDWVFKDTGMVAVDFQAYFTPPSGNDYGATDPSILAHQDFTVIFYENSINDNLVWFWRIYHDDDPFRIGDILATSLAYATREEMVASFNNFVSYFTAAFRTIGSWAESPSFPLSYVNHGFISHTLSITGGSVRRLRKLLPTLWDKAPAKSTTTIADYEEV